MRTLSERARDIRCAVFDVDGVMTDCKLYLAPDGTELKAVHVRDGLGLKLLRETLKSYGAKIWVEDRVGGGARFVVDLGMQGS